MQPAERPGTPTARSIRSESRLVQRAPSADGGGTPPSAKVIAPIAAPSGLRLVESWLDSDEAALYMRMHVKTIRRYAREGKIENRRCGREFRFRREWLDQFFENGGR